MTVRVTFEFTHTEDGIDVVSDVVPAAGGHCACEMAFALAAVAEVRFGAGAVSQALKAEPELYGHKYTDGVH
ncbi:hypothetical protein SX97_14140 [Salmonella enterica subsp. enterica serovar Newport]|nr:hypothetical protein [Salmonella enterica subsp. enterica serovar Newport]